MPGNKGISTAFSITYKRTFAAVVGSVGVDDVDDVDDVNPDSTQYSGVVRLTSSAENPRSDFIVPCWFGLPPDTKPKQVLKRTTRTIYYVFVWSD